MQNWTFRSCKQKGNMADYFTKFSLILTLPSEAAQTYALDLAKQATSPREGDEVLKGFPKELMNDLDDWNFETEVDKSVNGWGLWLQSGYGGVDAVCAFIQHLLQKFDPKGRVAFAWSYDCSKPRTDAYGGGA